VTFEKTTYALERAPASRPARLTSQAPSASVAAIDYLRRHRHRPRAAHERRLLAYATERWLEVPGLRLIGRAPREGQHPVVRDGRIHPHDLGTVVDSEGSPSAPATTAAQPVMRRLGVPATARASLAFYNTRSRSMRLVAALAGWQRCLADVGTQRPLPGSDPRSQQAAAELRCRWRGPRPAEGLNPLCGDAITVYLTVDKGASATSSFQGSGCAISKASASLMTDAIKGRTVDEAARCSTGFHRMVAGRPGAGLPDGWASLRFSGRA
jgi:hypothetical protein